MDNTLEGPLLTIEAAYASTPEEVWGVLDGLFEDASHLQERIRKFKEKYEKDKRSNQL